MPTVHRKVNAEQIRDMEELDEIFGRAKANPWHLFNHIHKFRDDGRPTTTEYGDGVARITPWNTLPENKRCQLGDSYDYAAG